MGWSSVAEMVASWLVVCLTFILLMSMIHQHNKQLALVALIPLSLLVFSPVQNQNWFWVLQNTWYITVFFLLASIWVIDKFLQKWKKLFVIGTLAICSTISLSIGLLVWPIILIAMMLYGYRKWQSYAYWITLLQ